ncbi:PQQ-dependent sugar dehydrogenase [Candidatus Mycolicibacterium alkanivorans]|uniref:Gluconolaconase n=1 Tax=Candidatus Mycolicibacterium alkanivorans TaxID=2954114 RepID=A0ABS9YRK0_9MYCO|nr:gluconolaconase [Candidatus Mycolicibacterium alkanivorans]MCI4673861.1 gluconolaconase [Candidatus Mycolicibacterium alkanivorans]
MPGWRASVACAAVLVTAACGQPAPTAPSASAPSGLVPVTVAVPAGMAQTPLDTPHQALVPPGWTLSAWARVPGARLAAWAPDGTLLVSVPASGRVVRLTPDGQQGRTSVVLEGLDQPHGLAFDGTTLYVAESDQINTFRYTGGTASDRRIIASGLPDTRSPELGGAYAHALKSVAVTPDGAVYFSIGSTGNISAADRAADPPRATILRIPPGGGAPVLFSSGVRNGTGLAVAPDGSVWTAVNNRDDVADPRPGPDYGKVTDYVNDHPPEFLARLTSGRELGWPFCNPDADGFVRDVQTNADGSELDCATLPPVEQTFGAHSAPLGLSFVDGALPGPFAQGALLGVHGSWNRTPPRAPEVSFFGWRSGTLGPQQTLVGGFQSGDGTRWGRPVAAVVGPDGAVYVTDDYAGAVYRLAPPGR